MIDSELKVSTSDDNENKATDENQEFIMDTETIDLMAVNMENLVLYISEEEKVDHEVLVDSQLNQEEKEEELIEVEHPISQQEEIDSLRILLERMGIQDTAPSIPTSTIFLAKIHEIKDPNIVSNHCDDGDEIYSFCHYGKHVHYNKITYVGFLGIITGTFKDATKKDIWWLQIQDEEKKIEFIWCRLQMKQVDKNEIDCEYEDRLNEFKDSQKDFDESGEMPEDYEEKCLMYALQNTRKILMDTKINCCFTRDDYDLIPYQRNHYQGGRKVFVIGKLAYIDHSKAVFLNSIKFFTPDDLISNREEATIRKMIHQRQDQHQ